MSRERQFREGMDGRHRPYDWRVLARQHGIPEKEAHELYERAVCQAGRNIESRQHEESLYLELLADARRKAWRPTPGKVTRAMRLQAQRAGKRREPHRSHRSARPIAPGARTLTWYLEPAEYERRSQEDGCEPLGDNAKPWRGRSSMAPAGPHDAPARIRDGSDPIAHRQFQADLAAAFGYFEELDIAGGPVEGWGASEPIQAAGLQGLPEAPVRLPGHGGGTEMPAPVRAKMEAMFAVSFAPVRIHEGPHVSAVGALAYTQGTDIHFAPGQYRPENRRGQELLGHELAHVVQQSRGQVRATTQAIGLHINDDVSLEREANEMGARAAQSGGGAASGVELQGGFSDSSRAGEKEMEPVVDRMAAGDDAGLVTASPVGVVQRFAPDGHERATIHGLTGYFSPEEIAATYASNWERDFSQGPAEIANAAIAWRSLKLHAADHDGAVGPAAAPFRRAVWALVDMNVFAAAREESLGNYQYWEHMDQPGRREYRNAERRWRVRAAGLAGYLNDSKAYIKDQMVAAVDVYRRLCGLSGVGAGIDNWRGARRPEDYVAPNVRALPGATGAAFDAPRGSLDDPDVISRDPIREQTRRSAVAARGDAATGPDPRHDAVLWRDVGHYLGRAMHAFEDFWAHSNWLELAQELKASREGGSRSEAIANRRLMTGTFTLPAQCHTLGHKILALVSAFRADFARILLQAYGCTAPSTRLSPAAAEIERRRRQREVRPGMAPRPRDQETSYWVFSPLQTDARTPLGEVVDIGRAANAVEEAVQSGHYTMADFLCNQDFLAALERKARVLIEQGDRESGSDSHGHLAKDQEEQGRNHRGAMALALAANSRIFGPLRQIMDDRDPGRAVTAIQAQLALVDQMLQAPSVSHPLWDVVVPMLGDFPMPADGVGTG